MVQPVSSPAEREPVDGRELQRYETGAPWCRSECPWVQWTDVNACPRGPAHNGYDLFVNLRYSVNHARSRCSVRSTDGRSLCARTSASASCGRFVIRLSTPRSIIRCISALLSTVQTWTSWPRRCAALMKGPLTRPICTLRKSTSRALVLLERPGWRGLGCGCCGHGFGFLCPTIPIMRFAIVLRMLR